MRDKKKKKRESNKIDPLQHKADELAADQEDCDWKQDQEVLEATLCYYHKGYCCVEDD